MSLANRSLQRRVDELERKLRERGTPSEIEYRAARTRLLGRDKLLERLGAAVVAAESGEPMPALQGQDAVDAATIQAWDLTRYGKEALARRRADAIARLEGHAEEFRRRAAEPRTPEVLAPEPDTTADDAGPAPMAPPTIEVQPVRPELAAATGPTVLPPRRRSRQPWLRGAPLGPQSDEPDSPSGRRW